MTVGGLCLPNSRPCSDRKAFVFWDTYHNSDAANRVITDLLWDGLPSARSRGAATTSDAANRAVVPLRMDRGARPWRRAAAVRTGGTLMNPAISMRAAHCCSQASRSRRCAPFRSRTPLFSSPTTTRSTCARSSGGRGVEAVEHGGVVLVRRRLLPQRRRRPVEQPDIDDLAKVALHSDALDAIKSDGMALLFESLAATGVLEPDDALLAEMRVRIDEEVPQAVVVPQAGEPRRAPSLVSPRHRTARRRLPTPSSSPTPPRRRQQSAESPMSSPAAYLNEKREREERKGEEGRG
uniref:Uncharacterized protein n=1 Tax=Oryza meridionalis TaxID=40149 RepID=A0A0E0EI78_9ORYZ